jgi:hypothetical protein
VWRQANEIIASIDHASSGGGDETETMTGAEKRHIAVSRRSSSRAHVLRYALKVVWWEGLVLMQRQSERDLVTGDRTQVGGARIA